MKEILDVVVWVGFAFVLFIFLRGMNETQVQKHQDKLAQAEDRLKEKENKKEEQ